MFGSGRLTREIFVHIEFCVKALHLGTVSVCLAWSSLLLRYCCCVDCLYCDLNMGDCSLYYIFWVTGNLRSTGSEIRRKPYHLQRSNVSVSFTMSSGGQESYSFIPRWNEEAATLQKFEQRIKLFVSSTKRRRRDTCVVLDFSPRLSQKETHFHMSETT